MNTLKYLHFNNEEILKKVVKDKREQLRSRTIVVEAISADRIVDLVKSFVEKDGQVAVSLNLGITFLGKNDHYSRAIGRDEARKRMKQVILNIENVTLTPTHTFVHLGTYEGVLLSLRLNRKSGYATVTGLF